MKKYMDNDIRNNVNSCGSNRVEPKCAHEKVCRDCVMDEIKVLEERLKELRNKLPNTYCHSVVGISGTIYIYPFPNLSYVWGTNLHGI